MMTKSSSLSLSAETKVKYFEAGKVVKTPNKPVDQLAYKEPE
jgi:hypothetical protein